MADVLIRRGNLDKDMHTGRTPCEDVGRDGVLLLQAKEPKVDIRPLEAGREASEEPALLTSLLDF